MIYTPVLKQYYSHDELSVPSPAPHKTGVAVHTSNPRGRGKRISSESSLDNKEHLKARLGYMRPCPGNRHNQKGRLTRSATWINLGDVTLRERSQVTQEMVHLYHSQIHRHRHKGGCCEQGEAGRYCLMGVVFHLAESKCLYHSEITFHATQLCT